MNKERDFPEEYYLNIAGDDRRRGQIIVNKVIQGGEDYYNAEINIVNAETSKIWQHVTIIYNYRDKDEIINSATQKLSIFLRGK